MIAEHPNSSTPALTLVNTLTAQLTDVLMRPATEALTETQCRTLRPRVAHLIAAGRECDSPILRADTRRENAHGYTRRIASQIERTLTGRSILGVL